MLHYNLNDEQFPCTFYGITLRTAFKDLEGSMQPKGRSLKTTALEYMNGLARYFTTLFDRLTGPCNF